MPSEVIFYAERAKKKIKSSIYYIMMRGINHQVIFEDEEDYERFLDTFDAYQKTITLKYTRFDMFAKDRNKAIEKFIAFNIELNSNKCLEMVEEVLFH